MVDVDYPGLGGAELATIRSHSIVIALTVLITLFVGFLMLFFGFGRGQEITPLLVEHKARLGMTVPQTEYALGLPPGVFKNWTKEKKSSESYVQVSQTGAIGSLFSAQHEIVLEFDSEGRLTAGYVTYFVPFKESEMALELRK